MHHPFQVRPVIKEDIPALAGMLTSVFVNDQVIRWFYPDGPAFYAMLRTPGSP